MLHWYGERCPTFHDMEEVACSCGVQVVFHRDFDVPRYFWDAEGRPWFIGIPNQFGELARCWALAHELGHLLKHGSAPRTHEQHRLQEMEADAWAACALIPYAAIGDGVSPNVHQLVYFLRKHYQQFGGKEDRVRALAYRIAFTRLHALEEDVA